MVDGLTNSIRSITVALSESLPQRWSAWISISCPGKPRTAPVRLLVSQAADRLEPQHTSIERERLFNIRHGNAYVEQFVDVPIHDVVCFLTRWSAPAAGPARRMLLLHKDFNGIGAHCADTGPGQKQIDRCGRDPSRCRAYCHPAVPQEPSCGGHPPARRWRFAPPLDGHDSGQQEDPYSRLLRGGGSGERVVLILHETPRTASVIMAGSLMSPTSTS